MKKLLNKNLISIFAIFALVLSFSLTNTVSARTVTVDFGANTQFDHWNNDNLNSGNNNSNNNSNTTNNTQNTSLVPHVPSISPTSGITKTGAKDITINGYNFIPSSVARWNGSDRNTSYISSSQIIMHTTDADMTGLGSQSITVYNHTSNGGLSNTGYYTLKTAPTTSVASASKTKPKTTAKPKTATTPACVSETTTDKEDNSNLTASAIFSSDSFLPTSFLGWLLLIILVLLIVIVWRKLTHAGEKYKAQPLKHA